MSEREELVLPQNYLTEETLEAQGIALDPPTYIEVRKTNWKRTLLVGAGLIAAPLAADVIGRTPAINHAGLGFVTLILETVGYVALLVCNSNWASDTVKIEA